MPLNPQVLVNGLLNMFSNPTNDYQEAAQRFADTYAAYAAGATSCMGASPASLDAAKATLVSALTPILTTSRDPGTTGNGMAQALTAFWMTPPVAFPSGQPGAVSLVGGTPALAAALAASAPINDANAAAQAFAAKLDAFTKTVTVAHGGPSPCALPIT